MGGGISTAAIGGSDEVMALIADGDYEQVGTFNGNPLAMAAARAMLTEVLDRRRRTPTSTRCATGCATGCRPSSTGTTRPGAWSPPAPRAA